MDRGIRIFQEFVHPWKFASVANHSEKLYRGTPAFNVRVLLVEAVAVIHCCRRPDVDQEGTGQFKARKVVDVVIDRAVNQLGSENAIEGPLGQIRATSFTTSELFRHAGPIDFHLPVR